MILHWLQRHPRLVDAGLVLVALATAGAAALQNDRRALGVPIGLLACLPLLARRRRPLAVLAVTGAATAVAIAVWGTYNPFPAGVALFSVADRCDRRTAVLAGAATIGVLAVPVSARTGWDDPVLLVGRLLGFVVAWLIGDAVGARRRYTEALEERAERLERERVAEAARAVAEEQARIARELHDVIAHNLSVIVVQATAAADVFDEFPERAREALRTIQRTGRSGLEDLRRLVGGVRGEAASYRPQPGLGDLEALVARVRAAGLAVGLSVEGEPRTLPPALDLSAYRIVQEALTNTLKHARANRADILLRYGDGALDVEVHDDGVGGARGNGAGHGLIGMRERLALLGGTLAAGPAQSGGFTVAAHVPTGAVR